jgi:DNA-binding transcriptional LysR family regulator
MREAAHEIELHAAGKRESLEGTVRITASVVFSVHLLPRMVAQIRASEPSIALELLASDESSNLHFREADIAIRMYRPAQLDLVTQHLGDLTLGVFAAKSYAAHRNLPKTPEELLNHDIVGFDRDPRIIEGFAQNGFHVSRNWFKVRVDNQVANWELVRAGCGIGFGQNVIGRSDPALVEVPLELGLPRLPIWLTVHEAVRQAPRVRRVWDLLAEQLRGLCAERNNTA